MTDTLVHDPDMHAKSAHRSPLSEHSIHTMPFGAELQADGSVRFRVWAPEAATLRLWIEGAPDLLAMSFNEDGWYELTTTAAGVGTRYRFVLPSGLHVPDPVSRYQPDDVNGPSEVVDPTAYRWRSLEWTGCSWEQAVLYELHIGTFTPQGTYRSAIDKLDYLSELGITAIEIMSLGEFPGNRSWGYDSVLLYAPDSMYGTPDDLKALIDAAHERRMMVILDVVYNHFGPEGNYIAQYFPDIVTDEYETPWGQALNFDARHSEKTRAFIIHNALYWIEEFRMDGLRLDAVHAIIDSSSTHILDELAQRVRAVAGARPVHLILESDDKVWHHIGRDDEAKPLSATAQWNHDMQQLARLALTHDRPEEQDLEDTERLGRALVEGFTSGSHHRNAPRNVPELWGRLSSGGFISFLQSHDIVGNRIRGERLTDIAQPQVVRSVAAIYLLAPQIPMLFMGEEWAASSPFPYFCDFDGELAEAIRRGRLEQFATPEQRNDPQFLASAPDPLAEETFLSAKLRWDELSQPAHRDWLDWYKRILHTRRHSVVPLLRKLHSIRGHYRVLGPRQIDVCWQMGTQELSLQANLSPKPSTLFQAAGGSTLWQEGTHADGAFGPWSVRWCLTPDQA
jgi:malto-oligosyltrehalose trehalohydrolase